MKRRLEAQFDSQSIKYLKLGSMCDTLQHSHRKEPRMSTRDATSTPSPDAGEKGSDTTSPPRRKFLKASAAAGVSLLDGCIRDNPPRHR